MQNDNNFWYNLRQTITTVSALPVNYLAILCVSISLLLMVLSLNQVTLVQEAQLRLQQWNLHVITFFHSYTSKIQRISFNLQTIQELKKENLELQNTNKHLRQQLEINSIIISDLKKLADSLHYQEGIRYSAVSTKIIGMKNFSTNNALYLNVGANNSIKKDNVVLNDDGVIGMVSQVFPQHSVVRSIIDPNSRVPCISVKTRIKSIVRGNNTGSDVLLIQPLTEQVHFEEGELIITAGDGNIYPHGLVMGHVKFINQQPFLQSSVDWHTLEFARVLINK